MKTLKSIASWLWRLAAAGAAHVVGLMVGGAVAMALGLEPMKNPQPDGGSGALLLPGGMAIALGLAVMATGLTGPAWRRWAILGVFAFVVNGVGTALELSRFTTLGGETFLTVSNLPASFLCAWIVAMLFPAPPSGGRDRVPVPPGPARLAGRLFLALLAFPAFYFLFGMMIAPIVLPYHAQLDFIVIPPLSILLPLLFARSALFLLASVPVIVFWGLTRGRLAFALAAGHFAAVGLSGLIQATLFPPVVRVTHAVEILATSICYGIALAWLLYAAPRSPEAARVDGQRAATGS